MRGDTIMEEEIRAIRAGRWIGDVDRAFARLVGGKRVAVVGPARTLVGRTRGASIDAHDLVVRFNDALDILPASAALAADMGARTDVLYANPVILQRLLARRDAIARAGLRYLVCTNNSLSFTETVDPPPPTRARTVRAASETLARWLGGNWARTGLIGIVDLLTFGVERLLLTGMTFYHGGGHLLTPDGTVLHPRKNRDGTWAQAADGVGHDSYRELDILRILAREFSDVLEMDEALAALVGRYL